MSSRKKTGKEVGRNMEKHHFLKDVCCKKRAKVLKKNQVEGEVESKTRISRNRSKSNAFMCCENRLVEREIHIVPERTHLLGPHPKLVGEE